MQLKGESPLNFQLHFIAASTIAIELLIIDGSKFSSLSLFYSYWLSLTEVMFGRHLEWHIDRESLYRVGGIVWVRSVI